MLEVKLVGGPGREVTLELALGGIGIAGRKIQDVSASQDAKADGGVEVSSHSSFAQENGQETAILTPLAAEAAGDERERAGGAELPGNAVAIGAENLRGGIAFLTAALPTALEVRHDTRHQLDEAAGVRIVDSSGDSRSALEQLTGFDHALLGARLTELGGFARERERGAVRFSEFEGHEGGARGKLGAGDRIDHRQAESRGGAQVEPEEVARNDF